MQSLRKFENEEIVRSSVQRLLYLCNLRPSCVEFSDFRFLRRGRFYALVVEVVTVVSLFCHSRQGLLVALLLVESPQRLKVFWQVASFRDQDANPKESFIYHNAGIAGSGNSSYIDSVLLRDKDTSAAWTAAASATLNERRYMLQNWRADVTTMVNTLGEPIEWYRYTAYGQPTSHPIADVNGDGTVDSAEAAASANLLAGDSSGSVWLTDDLNRDDLFPGNQADDDFFNAQYTAATSASPSGYDRQSAYGLRKGYAGYEWDDTLAMWHVRHRVLDSKNGKWTKRDPLGYVDGMSDNAYENNDPVDLLNAFDSEGSGPTVEDRLDIAGPGMGNPMFPGVRPPGWKPPPHWVRPRF